MKKIFGLLCMVIGFISCSQNYFVQHNVSPAYKSTARYKGILMKPRLVSAQAITTDEAVSRATFHLRTELAKRNFDFLPNDAFEEACRALSFGGSGQVSETVANQAAKKSGADVLVYCEIATESIKGGLPLMATIRIVSVADGVELYAGKARSDNPVSLEAGMEFAVEKALEGLK